MPTLKESNESIDLATFKEGKAWPPSRRAIAMATPEEYRAAMATPEEGKT